MLSLSNADLSVEEFGMFMGDAPVVLSLFDTDLSVKELQCLYVRCPG